MWQMTVLNHLSPQSLAFTQKPSPGGLLPQVKIMILEKQTSDFWLSISKPLSKR